MDFWSGDGGRRDMGIKSGTTFVLASFVNLQIFRKLANINAIK